MKIFRRVFDIAIGAGRFGVDAFLPAFGIPRPLSYIAAVLWLFWMANLTYVIIIPR